MRVAELAGIVKIEKLLICESGSCVLYCESRSCGLSHEHVCWTRFEMQ